ncbi:hypothetical protein B0H13DRAFT_1586844, partial [Mycena leptocephala]
YYRTAGATWKQYVRHHLSLNRLFERRPRPATDPGFASCWTHLRNKFTARSNMQIFWSK